MRDERALTEMIEGLVDKGATTAEEIHREVAQLPVSVLENLGLFPNTTDQVRSIQDQSIGAIYDAIRGINHHVSKLAEEVLQEAGEVAGPRDERSNA